MDVERFLGFSATSATELAQKINGWLDDNPEVTVSDVHYEVTVHSEVRGNYPQRYIEHRHFALVRYVVTRR